MSDQAKGPVICLGAVVLDLVFEMAELPTRPLKVLARSRTQRNGGPAGTAAVALAALGIPAAFWGNVGQDADGDYTRGQMARWGVDVGGLKQVENARTVLAIVMVAPGGERLIVAHGAEIFQRPADDLPLDRLGSAGAVLADSAWVNGTEKILGETARLGIPSVMDVEEGHSERLTQLARLATYPVICEPAFAQMSGGAPPGSDSITALSRELGRDIGVTLGEKGSLWCLGGETVHVPALAVDCKDTTGAGDVFHGVFAGGLALRMPIRDAIRMATAAAALKCQAGNGWNGMPDRAAVEAAMRRVG